MKPIDVTSDYYAEYNEDPTKKDPKFKAGDHVRISNYENFFAKWYAPNWSEYSPLDYVISDVYNEEIAASFYEKELQKTCQEKFRIEKERY